MRKETITTTQAPVASGPYAQAVKVGQLIFTSGQLPLDPATGKLAGDIAAQAEQALANLRAVLEAGGSDLQHVLKTTVFITDMKSFGTVNQVYSRYFQAPYPARSCVAVAELPKQVGIEIEAVAVTVQ